MGNQPRDLFWHTGPGAESTPRTTLVHDELRYAQGANQSDVDIDGFLNYHWLLSPADLGRPKIMLEAGINGPAEVSRPEGRRRPLIAIRSSPWKAGHETNPWHDDFDLDHGHVRYFGDHKPTTLGPPGATNGNKLLLEATRLHSGTTRSERSLAPPLLLGGINWSLQHLDVGGADGATAGLDDHADGTARDAFAGAAADTS